MTNQNILFSSQELKEIQSSFFTAEQIELIRKKTPKAHVEIKTDENGQEYKSVKASYVKKRLAVIFGSTFDFEVKSREYIKESKEVIVEGRLTVYSGCRPFTISREQFGVSPVTIAQTDSGGRKYYSPVNLGNSYKAAATDALKKCASEFNLFWDIYGQERPKKAEEVEAPVISASDQIVLRRLEHFLKLAKTASEVEDIYTGFLDSYEKTNASEALYIKYLSSFDKLN